MNLRMQMVRSLLLVGLFTLGGCSFFGVGGSAPSDTFVPGQDSGSPSENLPADPQATPPIAMPSPPILEGVGQLVPDGTRLTVTGTVKREKPEESVKGILVVVRNETQGTEVTVPVKDDGSYSVEITVREGDLIIVKAKDPLTKQKSNVLESVIPPLSPHGPTTVSLVDASKNDSDGDGVPNSVDVAPLNPTETNDNDQDGIGDNADPDDDNDGVLDVSDNCHFIANPDQVDTDGDGQGNACDTDDDNDGVVDASDNCPLVVNADQLDTDHDGSGDACDPDDDNDGVPDATDNCPLVSNPDQTDTDHNGVGDACDPNADMLVPIYIPATGQFFVIPL